MRLSDPRIETDRSKGWTPLRITLGVEPRTCSPVHEAVVIVCRLRNRIDAVAATARVENGVTARTRHPPCLVGLYVLDI
jgi:hypothetical protein